MDAQDPLESAEPAATVTRGDEKKKEEVVRKTERKDESEKFEHTQPTETTTLWKNLMNYVLGNQLKAQQQQHPNTQHTATRRRGPSSMKKSIKVVSVGYIEGLEPHSWLCGIVLSLWDNISGPKVEHVWMGSERISEEMQIYAAKHTLCGEIASPTSESHIETKFHVFSDVGYIITATLFSAEFLSSVSKYSLALLIKREALDRYLILHPIVEDRMFQLVSKLRVLMSSDPENAMKQFTSILHPYVHNLDAIYSNSLPPVKFSHTLFFESPNIDIECLAKAITSHLQTHGSTVVIGDSEEMINMFVDSLSLFLTTQAERKRSSHAHKGAKYEPDFLLQGIVTTSISDEEVIQSLLPTTLVDLHQKQVKQTHLFHEYIVLRREYLNMEFEKLYNTRRKEKNLWTTQNGPFKVVKSAAPCIEKILAEVFRLPQYLREGYIAQAMRLLIRKAVIVIKYVEAELERTQSPNLEASVVKKLRADLDLNSDADFDVLLGVAEKLSPGIYVALAGDPASIEEKFVELFESF